MEETDELIDIYYHWTDWILDYIEIEWVKHNKWSKEYNKYIKIWKIYTNSSVNLVENSIDTN